MLQLGCHSLLRARHERPTRVPRQMYLRQRRHCPNHHQVLVVKLNWSVQIFQIRGLIIRVDLQSSNLDEIPPAWRLANSSVRV